jgi:hypothetical protein
VASQVGGFTDEVTTAVGCAVGQAIGKVGIVLAIHRGSRSRTVQRLRERRERPASRPVAFEPGSGPGRTGCWDCLVTTDGECPLFSLRLPRYSAAVPSDPRRARDPDVGHSLRGGRLSREDGAVSRHRLRGLGIGRLSLHGAVRRDADPLAFATSLGTRRLQMSRFPQGISPGSTSGLPRPIRRAQIGESRFHRGRSAKLFTPATQHASHRGRHCSRSSIGLRRRHGLQSTSTSSTTSTERG